MPASILSSSLYQYSLGALLPAKAPCICFTIQGSDVIQFFFTEGLLRDFS